MADLTDDELAEAEQLVSGFLSLRLTALVSEVRRRAEQAAGRDHVERAVAHAVSTLGTGLRSRSRLAIDVRWTTERRDTGPDV